MSTTHENLRLVNFRASCLFRVIDTQGGVNGHIISSTLYAGKNETRDFWLSRFIFGVGREEIIDLFPIFEL